MAILFTANDYTRDNLYPVVKKFMPDLDVRVWPHVGNAAEIDYVIATGTAPTESLQNLPNLKAIFLTAAGVDAIVKDPALPDVPLVRCVNDSLTQGMAEYVVYQTLKFHRQFDVYERQQPIHLWKQHRQMITQDRVVGIMGMGEMGLGCAEALEPFGFQLRGWSRSPKTIDGITHFAGNDNLSEFLSGCHIVVCVLPLTDETHGILNRKNLSALPKGAFLISAGRGAHMVETDIIALLDEGHLAGAALDVFAAEPLPADNPLWAHPKITLTPHIASITDYKPLCDNIRQQMAAYDAGEPLDNLVDRKRGY